MTTRTRWASLAVLTLVVVAAVASVWWFVVRDPTVRLSGSVVLVVEGVDWTKGDAGGCRPASAANAFGPGSEVSFVGTDGANRGGFTIARYSVSTDGTDSDCRAYFRALELHGDEQQYTIYLNGAPVGTLERASIDAANAPDAYPGLGIRVTNCNVSCTVEA